MYNHSHTHNKKRLVTYGRKWNAQAIIIHQHCDKIKKILEKNGYKAGTTGYIGKYAKAVKKVMDRMDKTEIAAAAELAEEWNESQPPAKIQSE